MYGKQIFFNCRRSKIVKKNNTAIHKCKMSCQCRPNVNDRNQVIGRKISVCISKSLCAILQ